MSTEQKPQPLCRHCNLPVERMNAVTWVHVERVGNATTSYIVCRHPETYAEPASPAPQAECGQPERDAKLLAVVSDPDTVWYGPHPCELCGKSIIRESRTQRSGYALDAPETFPYPNFNWTQHNCKVSICPRCDGTGKYQRLPNSPEKPCAVCDGSGKIGEPVAQQEVCPNALLPDGPVCPRCGGHRAPSGVDGGSWVHFERRKGDRRKHAYTPDEFNKKEIPLSRKHGSDRRKFAPQGSGVAGTSQNSALASTTIAGDSSAPATPEQVPQASTDYDSVDVERIDLLAILKAEGLSDWKLEESGGGYICIFKTKQILMQNISNFHLFLHEVAHAKCGIKEGHGVIWGDEFTDLVNKYTRPNTGVIELLSRGGCWVDEQASQERPESVCGNRFKLRDGYVCSLKPRHKGLHESTCPNTQFHQEWSDEDGVYPCYRCGKDSDTSCDPCGRHICEAHNSGKGIECDICIECAKQERPESCKGGKE